MTLCGAEMKQNIAPRRQSRGTTSEGFLVGAVLYGLSCFCLLIELFSFFLCFVLFDLFFPLVTLTP